MRASRRRVGNDSESRPEEVKVSFNCLIKCQLGDNDPSFGKVWTRETVEPETSFNFRSLKNHKKVWGKEKKG